MKPDAQSVPDLRMAPIRPERIAEKLAAIRNYEIPELLKQIGERPRLVELLWFLQAMSLRPGALAKFTEELLAEFPERLGTPAMIAARGKRYTLETKLAVLGDLPMCEHPIICQEVPDLLPADGDYTAAEQIALVRKHRRELESTIKDVDAGYFHGKCTEAALAKLPDYLASLCLQKNKGFIPELHARTEWSENWRNVEALKMGIPIRDISETWYFSDPIGAVFEFMDRHAAKVQTRLAMTKVAAAVFDALDYAADQKVMVRIAGNSRFGKTEALKTWCEMRPGLARLVAVPCDNSMQSLFKRIGEALGMDFSYGSNLSRLKARIEYVIAQSGLFFVLDESHFLIPQNYSRTTSPHRLNWIRTEIVDRGLPLALAFTPQAFKSEMDRFTKKTGFNTDQFFGRDFLPCTLPETLSEADLIAVARIHFPEMSKSALGYIANTARLTPNYLQAVQAIAKRARYLAARRSVAVTIDDIEAATSDVLPQFRHASESAGARLEAPDEEPGALTAPARATALQARCKANSSRIKPARNGDTFPDSSLRRAGAEREETELVSVDT